MFKRTISVLTAALLISPAQILLAQTSPPTAPPSAQPVSESSQQLLSAGQLEALVAPIALYPDALLSQLLMASTYPLEVVEAARWATTNKSLKGDALKSAVDKQKWEDAVKSLVATPDVLQMMSDKLSWTQQLGDAVLAQQPDIMDAIQRLRTKAQANKKLNSNQQQTVKSEQQGGKQVIVIAPTNPETIYVPYYDPAVVYGSWPYPAYPPYYWPAPGYIAGGIIATGIAFGAGFALGRWASGGYWGGGFNWGGNNININRNTNINNINRGNGNNWNHNPAHRQGVRYNNSNVAAKFGGNQNRPGASDRMDFRGRGGNQVLNPGAGGSGNRPNAGGGANRPSAGGGANRPSAGGGANRPSAGGGANRPSAGGGANRPSGGANRPSAGGGANRPSAGGGGNAFDNAGAGRAAGGESARGRASMGGGGGGGARSGGGGGGRGGGGGGRRSDMRLKHDIVMLGRLSNGLGYYRFAYNGGHTAYVGVMAQEVQSVMPDAVARGSDGFLRVYYNKIGVKFETYADWLTSGARLPQPAPRAQ